MLDTHFVEIETKLIVDDIRMIFAYKVIDSVEIIVCFKEYRVL